MNHIPKEPKQQIDLQIRSKRPIICICSHEEMRVINAITEVSRRDSGKNWSIVEWDCASGINLISPGVKTPVLDDLPDPVMALEWFKDAEMDSECEHAILVLKDFHKMMGSDGNSGILETQIVRQLKNMAQSFMGKVPKTIIIISPTLFLPQEIEKLCAVIDWPLPDSNQISLKLTTLLDSGKNSARLKDFKLQYSPVEMESIIAAFQGLTMDEIELLCAYMLLTSKSLIPSEIAQHKREIIRKAGMLDWIETNDTLSAVGGLHELKLWLKKRVNSFTDEAVKFGLPANPKGVLLLGIQGGGKSLVSRAIADYWGLPLLRIDIGKIFHGIVGASEANLRHVFKTAESISPCVLWCDEIDKAMSGSGSSNLTDGGTSARVLGSLLTWMQEKQSAVYVVATANDVTNLPPELLRKGRFDEIFFVDLPSEEDRAEIFSIHIQKCKRDPSQFDIDALAEITDGYTGAEIEACIISGMYDAFDEKRDVTTKDIMASITETIPISVTMSEKITALREWALKRARNASVATPRVQSLRQETVQQPKPIEKADNKFTDLEEEL